MHSRKCNETQAAATPHRWTAEQEKVLSDVFAEEIKEQNITLQNVEQLIKDHPVLKDFSATKICDKVRYMYNDNVPSAMVPPQEEETSGDRLARLGILANDIGEASSTNPKRKRNAKTASCDSEYTPSVCFLQQKHQLQMELKNCLMRNQLKTSERSFLILLQHIHQ